MALTWTFQGSIYELVKTPKSFNEAKQAASAAGSYLAKIDSLEENNAVFEQVSSLISTAEFNSTTSPDGGGSAYVWIGGSDQESEGTWKWVSSGETISLSRGEWGSGALGSEPDGGTFQNGLGLGLENWPKGSSSGSGYGNAGSWNDINTSSALFYVTEKAAPQDTSSSDTVTGIAGSSDTLFAPEKFKKKFVDKITNFDPSVDALTIDADSFGIDGSATFAAVENNQVVKKNATKKDIDFLYDEKKGGLYFNENGADKGFGDGGIFAILKGAPDLTASNLEFI